MGCCQVPSAFHGYKIAAITQQSILQTSCTKSTHHTLCACRDDTRAMALQASEWQGAILQHLAGHCKQSIWMQQDSFDYGCLSPTMQKRYHDNMDCMWTHGDDVVH